MWLPLLHVPSSSTSATFTSNALGGVSLTCKVSASGTYTVNWGDGNTTSGIASNSPATHTYGSSAVKTLTITADGGKNLTSIEAVTCGILTANIKSNTSLTFVNIGSNALTSLDVTGLVNLLTLAIGQNFNFTTLTGISTCTAITSIVAGDTKIGTFSLVDTPALVSGVFIGSELTSFTIAGSAIKFLYLSNNPFTAITNVNNFIGIYLDASSCTSLTTLYIDDASNCAGISGSGDSALTNVLLTGYKGSVGGTSSSFIVTSFNDCNMNAVAINALFTSLGTAYTYNTISVTGNPGAATCTPLIAILKGWNVLT